MNATTHITVGAMAGGTIAAYAFAQGTAAIDIGGYSLLVLAAIPAAAMGGIAPDVDMAHSRFGKMFRNILRCFLLLSALLLAIITFAPAQDMPFIGAAAREVGALDRMYPALLFVICVALFVIIE